MLFFLPFSVIATEKMRKKKPLVYLLLGQSNMSGQGEMGKLNQQQKRFPSNVTLIVHGDIVSLAQFSKFGPEVSFAQAIAKKYPKKAIRLIKYAPGGSLMKDWTIKKQGTHYDTLIKQIKHSNHGKIIPIDGILWMHGERDTKSKQLAKGYEAGMKRLLTMLRAEFDKPTLPVVIARINMPKAFRPAVPEVRKAQENIAKASPYTSLISTDDLSKVADNVHYDTKAQLALGARFAEAIIKIN